MKKERRPPQLHQHEWRMRTIIPPLLLLLLAIALGLAVQPAHADCSACCSPRGQWLGIDSLDQCGLHAAWQWCERKRSA